ncbi:hypothetical protein MHU86_12139 [Fragilaria crotonensis]|nr:hypothetical protein MHU86_12139 [Fragilaria crotonensis]
MDVNIRDRKGRSAFYLATVIEDRWDVVRELLKRGELDVNVQGPHGNTALIWACLRGRLDLVGALSEDDRVDVSVRNKAGSTALDIARKCELFEIANCLEEFTKACLCRKSEAKILRQGMELNSRDKGGVVYQTDKRSIAKDCCE